MIRHRTVRANRHTITIQPTAHGSVWSLLRIHPSMSSGLSRQFLLIGFLLRLTGQGDIEQTCLNTNIFIGYLAFALCSLKNSQPYYFVSDVVKIFQQLIFCKTQTTQWRPRISANTYLWLRTKKQSTDNSVTFDVSTELEGSHANPLAALEPQMKLWVLRFQFFNQRSLIRQRKCFLKTFPLVSWRNMGAS